MHRLMALIGLLVALTSVFAEPLDKIVAVVNDTVITQSELAEQTTQVKKNLQNKNVPLPSGEVLQKQVLNHIIDLELQKELAGKMGLDVSDDELEDGLNNNILKRNNLSLAELKKTVKQQGMEFDEYKANIKKEMLLAKLQQQMVGKTVSVSDEEVDAFLKAHSGDEKTSYHLKDIVVPLSEAPSPQRLAEAEKTVGVLLKKLNGGADFSQEALANSSGVFALEGGDLGFRTLAELPSLFSKDVQSMKVGDIKGPIRAPNGLHIIKLVEIKSDQQKHWVSLTKAQHILVTARENGSDAKALSLIKKIKQELSKGQSFEALAKKYSEDTNSAIKGGVLGWVHKGELVPEFESAMNKLKIGELSQPVKSEFGYHLIKVLGRKKIDDSKEQQKLEVKRNLYQAKFQEAVQTWLQKLRADSYVKLVA